MSGWFDRAAKRSAGRTLGSSAAGSQGGTSRRHVIAGGAAAVGTAWAAPVLMGAAPAYAGISTCPDANLCPGKPVTANTVCCPGPVVPGAGTADGQYNCNTGTTPYSCTPAPGTVGGLCTNEGQGTSGCVTNSVKCNGNKKNGANICGGPGAQCSSNSDCTNSMVCSGAVCKGKAGDPCYANVGCATNVCSGSPSGNVGSPWGGTCA